MVVAEEANEVDAEEVNEVIAEEIDEVILEAGAEKANEAIELVIEARLEAAREFFEIRPHQDTRLCLGRVDEFGRRVQGYIRRHI